MSDTPTGPAKKATTRKKATSRAKAAPSLVETAEPESDISTNGLPPPYPPPGESGPNRQLRLVTAIAAALVLLLAGALIFTITRISDNNNANSLRNSALKDAATYGAWVSSYDYTNLTAPTSTWTLIESHSTPTFKTSFDKTKASLTTLVKDYNAKAAGKVVAVGISSLSSSRAVVLLFIDQTVTNNLQKNGSTTEPLRAELILTRSHGRWLINDLQVPT